MEDSVGSVPLSSVEYIDSDAPEEPDYEPPPPALAARSPMVSPPPAFQAPSPIKSPIQAPVVSPDPPSITSPTKGFSPPIVSPVKSPPPPVISPIKARSPPPVAATNAASPIISPTNATPQTISPTKTPLVMSPTKPRSPTASSPNTTVPLTRVSPIQPPAQPIASPSKGTKSPVLSPVPPPSIPSPAPPPIKSPSPVSAKSPSPPPTKSPSPLPAKSPSPVAPPVISPTSLGQRSAMSPNPASNRVPAPVVLSPNQAMPYPNQAPILAHQAPVMSSKPAAISPIQTPLPPNEPSAHGNSRRSPRPEDHRPEMTRPFDVDDPEDGYMETAGADVPLYPVSRSPPTIAEHGCVVRLSTNKEANGKTACFRVLSLVYAKILVVVCIAFLISEIITDNVPLYYYEAFFTYLYGGSILFLLYVFLYLLSGTNHPPGDGDQDDGDCCSPCCGAAGGKTAETSVEINLNGSSAAEQNLKSSRPMKTKTSDNDRSHGGFFLRIGAITFGLGTMVYCGLKVGSFFEVPQDSPCWDVMLAVNPCLQATFTFMQMYFIFMNPRLNIHKFKVVARFGLMHVVGTNICVWIRTLTRESLRVFTEYGEANGTHKTEDFMILVSRIEKNFSCYRSEIMGTIVEDASPYLFPLMIEYSLIGAVVLYVMWKNIGRCPTYIDDETTDGISVSSRKARKVDCIGVSKGLFFGLLVLVTVTVCLVSFFVLVRQSEHYEMAIFLADTSHAGVLVTMTLLSLVGLVRNRKLKYIPESLDDMDAILLRISGFGLLLYSAFCLIAGALSPLTEVSNILVLVTSSLVILQLVVQIIYISDVSKRRVYLPEHARTKPGRQVVTFLLLCNMTLWVVYTFEIDKVEANPVQLDFYGRLHWAVILRVTLPLAIFHRFHSAVVLADVWKSSYRGPE